MIIWIDNGKYITALNKKFIHFFFIWITQIDTENEMDAENDLDNN